jgi:hypothetical protein
MITMAKQLKVYRVEAIYGFISPDERELLGLDRWVSQGDIHVTGRTKVEALDVLERLGHRQSPYAVRLATGSSVEAMRAAGVFDEPGIIVITPMTGGRSNRAVVVRERGKPELLGRFEGSAMDRGSYRFVVGGVAD